MSVQMRRSVPQLPGGIVGSGGGDETGPPFLRPAVITWLLPGIGYRQLDAKVPLDPGRQLVGLRRIDDVGAALAYVGAAVSRSGVAHAIPTGRVVAGFEPTTRDNHRVIVQEWLAEAVTMWGLASILIAVTVVASHSEAAAWTYRVVAGVLIALAALTGFTGARTSVVWFKICPVLLTCSAALLLAASVVS